jgi:hypothetical protein
MRSPPAPTRIFFCPARSTWMVAVMRGTGALVVALDLHGGHVGDLLAGSRR